MFNGNKISTLVSIGVITCITYGGCAGVLSYGVHRLYEFVDEYSPDIEVDFDDGDDDDNDEDVPLEKLVDSYKDKNRWCRDIKKNLSEDGSLSDFETIIKDYVASRGGEEVVKDGSTLYSQMVAPIKETGCEDSKLLNQFVARMTELCPDVDNINIRPPGGNGYLLLEIVDQKLWVTDALLYDLYESVKL